MTALAETNLRANLDPPVNPGRRMLRFSRVTVGGSILVLLLGICVIALPWTLRSKSQSNLYYNSLRVESSLKPPTTSNLWEIFGTSKLGQSLLGQCLAGGVISLTIGFAAAAISVVLGVSVGLIAGYQGGWLDAVLMRIVDILYALPYLLLVILFKLAIESRLTRLLNSEASNLIVLFLSIGLVSWLTMARVIRGQVLSLRTLPFIEAARAAGVPRYRIFLRHLLPNLIGPITVYATLTVPQAILQESILSFLGIGIQRPLPTWGSLASDGMGLALTPVASCWWLLLFPCTLLAVTLLALNFVGDGLRDAFDPKREGAKI